MDNLKEQFEAMLEEIAADHLKTEISYSGFVSILLESYLSRLTPGSSAFVQLKLLQARLQPPLTHSELNILNEFISQLGDDIRGYRELQPALMVEAVSPLLAAFGIEAFPGVTPPEPPVGPGPEEAGPETAHHKPISLLEEAQHADLEEQIETTEPEDEFPEPYHGAEEEELAEAVLESQEAAIRWLQRPQTGLSERTPLELMKNEPGAREVEELLYRIEYSIYS